MDGPMKRSSSMPDDLPLEHLLEELTNLDTALREVHIRRNEVISMIKERIAATSERLYKSEESANDIYMIDSKYNVVEGDSADVSLMEKRRF